MKVYLSVLLTIIGFAACTGEDATSKTPTVLTDTANYTTIQWIDSVKDVGIVTKGRIAEIQFKFVNTGEKPLFIISAKPGCGCTVADYPKEAIVPGSEGVITANYDSNKGSMGDFRKSISITTNTKGTANHFIFFYGKVMTVEDSVKQKLAADTTLHTNSQQQ